MPALQIQLLTGPGAGRKAVFAESPITFGRDADNTLVVGDAYVSRHHGELRLENNQWVLVNLSPNGTKLSGRKVTNKPRPVKDQDVIVIGDQPVFQVALATDEQAAQGDQAADLERGQAGGGAPGTTTPAAKKKSRMWMAIGGYMLGILVIAVLLGTLGGPKDKGAQRAAELSAQQIRDEIWKQLRAPPAGKNEAKGRERLETANELYGSREGRIDGYYRCYRAYLEALNNYGWDTFPDPQDGLRFKEVRDELVRRVTARYQDAYTRMGNNDFPGAGKLFKGVTDLYPDNTSLIYKNCIDHQNYARAKMGKRRGRT